MISAAMLAGCGSSDSNNGEKPTVGQEQAPVETQAEDKTETKPKSKVTSAFDAFRPDHAFDPARAVAAPDYADAVNWAALPGVEDHSDMQPAGTTDGLLNGETPVDVFFIHPTGYFHSVSWTSPMETNTMTQENTQWMMANLASPFNGCCNVYAPRYRQANLFAFLSSHEERDEILDFVYQDIEASFKYFLENYSKGRPFIIASHSQGSYHGLRLLERIISGTPLKDRLVAAYLIGTLTNAAHTSRINKMSDIHVCQQAEDIGCVIHFDVFSDAVSDEIAPDNVCVNPLSWTTTEELVTKEKHLGAVFTSGKFQVKFDVDTANNMEFTPLPEPDKQFISAQCKNGLLFVPDLKETQYGGYESKIRKGSYHLIDFNLFYMDIRENAKVRAAKFLAKTQ
ncbi:MAG: DUF3089 domain-containing protein [Cellvibrionaceae bacterium]